jgi:uncharacterized protein (DUF1015 family)
MARIEPFRAWRPRRDLAAQVASPPYDVLNTQEARQMAEGNQVSFLHVVKPEIDLPPETPPYDSRVYEQGAANLRGLIDQGVLIREAAPALYVYRQQMGDHVQTGVVAGASIDEYESQGIKKHEHTRPDKEDDRTRHVNALNANTGPVFLTYPADATVDGLVDRICAAEPEYDFTSQDGVRHTLWVVAEEAAIADLRRAFAAVPHLYVADGHHRSASATRVRALRREANANHRGDEAYNFFLTVIFPDDQMMILPYNRLVRDLNGLDEATFLARLETAFEVTPAEQPEPREPRSYGMYLGGRWLRLTARPGSYPADDPVASLDCAILQDGLLRPILGIANPRTDERIDFVGGIRGTGELERRCREEGWAVAFALYPTSIEQLMSVADADQVMPPKSTWFEPKLRSGLIVRPLDD